MSNTRYSGEWEQAEIALRDVLDADDALEVLQSLQGLGFKSPDEIASLRADRDEAEKQVLRLVRCIVEINDAFSAENAGRLGYCGAESPHTPLSEAIWRARHWISDATFHSMSSAAASTEDSPT